jgi:hypothetical protein
MICEKNRVELRANRQLTAGSSLGSLEPNWNWV